MEINKRKTKTSAAVKNRYNDKKYDRINLTVPKGEKEKIKAHADKHMEEFNALLLDYYNTGEAEALKQFLYDNAIQGIEI